jgi:hypothetical protein
MPRDPVLTAHDARSAHEAQSHDNVVTRYDRIPCNNLLLPIDLVGTTVRTGLRVSTVTTSLVLRPEQDCDVVVKLDTSYYSAPLRRFP